MDKEFDKQQQSIHGIKVTDDVICLKTMIVNVCLVGNKNKDWVLIDTGVMGSKEKILEAADKWFDRKPIAIVLTHGHFDHIGTVKELSELWDVPVYAHELELPYLTGQKNYPSPDPSVGGGLMSLISPLYPNEGINLGHRVIVLPEDGSIPPLPEWKWVHTPGHTMGQIALFRESDRILIAADAITTVKQESALAVLTQKHELHGPPAYFTTDWKLAENSLKRLQELNPSIVISSHGIPMKGEELTKEFESLVKNFDTLEKPEYGKYVE